MVSCIERSAVSVPTMAGLGVGVRVFVSGSADSHFPLKVPSSLPIKCVEDWQGNKTLAKTWLHQTT